MENQVLYLGSTPIAIIEDGICHAIYFSNGQPFVIKTSKIKEDES